MGQSMRLAPHISTHKHVNGNYTYQSAMNVPEHPEEMKRFLFQKPDYTFVWLDDIFGVNLWIIHVIKEQFPSYNFSTKAYTDLFWIKVVSIWCRDTLIWKFKCRIMQCRMGTSKPVHFIQRYYVSRTPLPVYL